MRNFKKPSMSEVYDAPVEAVIACGRLVLSIVLMVAVAFGGSEPPEYTALVLLVLRLYSAYSIVTLFMLARGREPVKSTTFHLIDLAVTSALLLVTQGLVGPFAFFLQFHLVGGGAALELAWGCIDGGISVLPRSWVDGG